MQGKERVFCLGFLSKGSSQASFNDFQHLKHRTRPTHGTVRRGCIWDIASGVPGSLEGRRVWEKGRRIVAKVSVTLSGLGGKPPSTAARMAAPEFGHIWSRRDRSRLAQGFNLVLPAPQTVQVPKGRLKFTHK